MGVLPLTFKDGETRSSLKLDGNEVITLEGLAGGLRPRMDVACVIKRSDGSETRTSLLCRLDTGDEVDYYRHGGILHYVLRSLLAQSPAAGSA